MLRFLFCLIPWLLLRCDILINKPKNYPDAGKVKIINLDGFLKNQEITAKTTHIVSGNQLSSSLRSYPDKQNTFEIYKKAEVILLILSDQCLLDLGSGEPMVLEKEQTVFLPAGTPHQVYAKNKSCKVLLFFQSEKNIHDPENISKIKI